MKIPLPLRILFLFFSVTVIVLLSCRLTPEEDKVTQTISFEKLYDSLSLYDSVQIQVEDPEGNFLDLIFHGKVSSKADIRQLEAPHYDGKDAIIVITGYIGDIAVYKVDRKFDGSTNVTDSIIPIITPTTSLQVDSRALEIVEGDSLPLPKVTVTPSDLANKTLVWSSLDTQFLVLNETRMLGKARGKAKVSVKLKSDLTKEILFSVQVLPNPLVPDSLLLSPETLFVAAKGASKKFKTAFYPITAKPALLWHSSEGATAIVSESGDVYGVRKGLAKIWAVSQVKGNVSDTAWVSVSEHIAVTAVRFQGDSLNLFIGGAAELLVTSVTPDQANPEMDFIVRDTSKVVVVADRIKGIEVGTTWVVAVSRDNPLLMDSIRVNILGTQQVDSVVANPRSLNIYTGGKDFSVTAKVYPLSAYAKIQWRSSNPAFAMVDAFGKVSAVAPGNTYVVGTSLADSLKKDSIEVIVKQDVPKITMSVDSVVSQGQTVSFLPEVSQEYGDIVRFKWDLDGDGTWDDSSTSVKPVSYKYVQEKEYRIGFYVRDGEGNWDTAQFKFRVKSTPLAVAIFSPGRDTVVNTPSIVIQYKVNEVSKSKPVTLRDGLNVIVIDTSNEKGSGRDSVRITLDTVAPIVNIKSPTSDQSFNVDSIPVVWTVDGNLQSTQNVASLGKTDGGTAITREFTDAAGNIGKFTVSVTRDTKAPVITITSPKDSENTKEAVVNVTWFADGVRQSTDTSQILVDGVNTIIRKATDAAGNTDSTSIRITYFSKPPAVKILAPSDSAVIVQKNIAVHWTVNGIDQKVDTLQDLVEGANVIVRKSADPVGNVGTASVTVFFNPKVPDVQITSPISGMITSLLTVPIAWKINGVDQPTQPESLLSEGENSITRKFKDSLGYEGVSTIKVIRDTRAPNQPSLTVANSLINTQNATASATWNWSSGGDDVGGAGTRSPKAYRYQVDGGAAVATAAESYSLANPGDGLHSLVVQEQDKAGNWSAYSAAGTITVDKTPPNAPVVIGESPSSNPIWTWTSGGGGKGLYRYRLDNGAYISTTKLQRYNPGSVSDMDHVLFVQEQDDAGNWSADGSQAIAMDRNYPTIPVGDNSPCMVAGSTVDTVAAEMDSEGFRPIFDGKTLAGWWEDCQTGHTTNRVLGAIFGVDPNSHALYSKAAGTEGGVLMTNKIYANYEFVMDLWPKFGNDAGIFNRSTTAGACYQTTLDYFGGGSLAGAWGEGGFTSLDYRPFTFNGNEFTLTIPGNSAGVKSNWTTSTSTLNPTSFGCSSGGCTKDDWVNVWNTNGWNQIRVDVFGNPLHVRSYIRRFGASEWVPVLNDTMILSSAATGYIGLNVHGGGRWSSYGNWYRNIKVRELSDSGNPL